MNFRQVVSNGLFAETIFARFSRLDNVLGVRVGGRANGNRFNFGVVENVVGVFRDILDTELRGVSFGLLVRERISDSFNRQLRYEKRNVANVHLADSACSDNSNFH